MPQTDYRDAIFALLFDLIHGKDVDPNDVSDEEIEQIAVVAENIVRMTLISARKMWKKGSFVCEGCNCQIRGGPKSKIHGMDLCPGCVNYYTLIDEVMRSSAPVDSSSWPMA